MIQIEKGIPIPRRAGGPGCEPKYPFMDLEVGDSFYVENANFASLRAGSYNYRQKTGRTFATRKMGNGVRVWRTA